MCLPLRMPLISGNEYPRTGEGFRWSWTMMSHGWTPFLSLDVPDERHNGAPGRKTQVSLWDFYPQCARAGAPSTDATTPKCTIRWSYPGTTS